MIFKVIDIHGVRLYGIFCHASKMQGVIGYWQHPGIGISARLADFLYPYVQNLQDFEPFDANRIGDDDYCIPKPVWLLETPAHLQIKERIVSLLKSSQAPSPPHTSISPVRISTGERLLSTVTTEDVYLFPSGMAALYRLHVYLTAANDGEYKSAAFGSLFQSTFHILEEYGAGFQLFPHGDETDLVKLEAFCKSEIESLRKVQAVYVEFPSNPNLVSSDLEKLRALADKYEFILVVDETIGSFANVDLFSVADVIATSLTKGFSGYSNVMAGSLVLNPESTTAYRRLKPLLQNNWHNELFAGDAIALEDNSRNYIERMAVLNHNAEEVAAFLHTKATDPRSSVSKVNYPSVSDTRDRYLPFMRADTPEFQPGYGCLLSVEFTEMIHTVAFYDALQLHFGPHLGAQLSLALPYNKAVYGRTREGEARAEANGWTMKQIRISVGLEDTEELVAMVQEAVATADALKH